VQSTGVIKNKLKTHIQLKLFASLQKFTPPTSDNYPIDAGQTIHSIIDNLNIPLEHAKLIFINGVRSELSSKLKGGERVGIFPPVGGG
jgi:molybdopterin converting factor small subunit